MERLRSFFNQMKAGIEKAVHWIINVGISEELDFYDQLKYKAFNQAQFAVLVALLIMIVSDVLEKNETLIYSILAFALTAFIFVLVHLRLHSLAVLLFSSLYPFLLFILTILYGNDLNIGYVYFAFIVL